MDKIDNHILIIGGLVVVSIFISIGSMLYLNNSISNLDTKLSSINNSLQLESESHFVGVMNKVYASTVRVLGCPATDPNGTSEVIYVDNSLGPCDLSAGFSYNDNGNIISSAHGVKPPHRNTYIMFDNGTILPVGTVKLNEPLDLAILEVKTNLPKLEIDADTAAIGSSIGFVGYPLGQSSKITTKGTISGLLPYTYDNSQQVYIYTLSAFVNRGNSGGAVFSLKTGKVVGIINQVRTDVQGVGISTLVNQELIRSIS